MNTSLEVVKTITPYLALSGFLLSIVSFIVSLSSNRRNFKKQLFKEILDEFDQEKLGKCTYDLWNFYGIDPETYIERYVEAVKNGDNELHFKRRHISSFYQKLAFYYKKGYISKKDIKVFWGKSFADTITLLLLPIEYKAMPQILHTEMALSEKIKNMSKIAAIYSPREKRWKRVFSLLLKNRKTP
ncbi:hypothetical protein D0T50_06835 [Bacteroides sp. 214]|uniref:hypothetical protein n=1 Tax=Bacteroides sp. 214 TaxID=2302935 RepID=UPI0013D7B857|nr:hypothetical protein [Bacteroides sp. 214]NDW12603.1 hypothetical protein [Bacteroides sp. 214]